MALSSGHYCDPEITVENCTSLHCDGGHIAEQSGRQVENAGCVQAPALRGTALERFNLFDEGFRFYRLVERERGGQLEWM